MPLVIGHILLEATINLLIATPCLDGKYERTFLLSLISTLWNLNKEGISVIWKDIPYCSDLSLARNKIFGEFYRNKQYTHLLMVDADMGWNGELVSNLLKMNLEFVASAGPKKKYPIEYCTTTANGITYVGMGFVIINRECASKLVEEYQELRFMENNLEEYDLFKNVFVNGKRLSEDYSFCHLWGKINGKITLVNLKLTHTGAHTYGIH